MWLKNRKGCCAGNIQNYFLRLAGEQKWAVFITILGQQDIAAKSQITNGEKKQVSVLSIS